MALNNLRIPRPVWITGVVAVAVGLVATASWELVPLRGAPGDDGSPPVSQGSQVGRPQRGEPDPLPPSRWPWWRDEDVQKHVGLTADQVRAIDRIYEQRRDEIDPFLKEFGRQRAEVNRVARNREAAVEEFAVLSARFAALNAKLTETRMVMLYRMSLELTAEQYQKLQQYGGRRPRGGDRGRAPDR